nr:PREDICTED: fibrous sheath CABYR-binding protein-like [Daucus carota subsp. sativus]
MPDKYGPLFSDENIPHPPSSSAQPDAHPTSGPSQQGPVVKSDQTLTSGPSQKGPVETTSPKRVLRSSKSPTKKQRKKIKPTDITDLTVETPQSEDPIQALIQFSDQPSGAEPVMIEPISAVRLEPLAADIQMSESISACNDQPVVAKSDEVLKSEDPIQALIQFSDQPSGAEPVMIEPISAVRLEPLAADIQMSESISACNDQPVVAKSDEVLKVNQESLIQHEDITAADTHVSDKTPDIPSQSEDAHIEVVLQMIQDSLIQTQANVAAPVQEVPIAATSDAATEALASHTLSIFVNDDDDDDATEVTSVPIQASASPISDPVRESTPVRIDSPVHTLSPVRESTPTLVHASPIQHPIFAQRKVCPMSYFKRMCRAPPPSVDDRLASIEATQTSMQHTLAHLSASVAQLVQPSEDEEGNREIADKQLKLLQIKEKERSNKEANSDRPRDSQQKHKSMELTVMSQVQSISEAVRISDDISKELAVVNSEVEKKKKEDLIPESDKLIEAGDPESQKFCQTLKFRGVDIEAIRLEEERLAAEKRKISRTKSDEQKQITDPSQNQKNPKQKD